MRKAKNRNRFLFCASPFLVGMGSIFNVAGNYSRNKSASNREANAKAIRSVWQAVGDNMRDVLEKKDTLLKA